ncbi:ROK family glucokinase [Coprococcus catus]|uniref:ROK family glucokinase n=1 Tax=Coprococcus catus TaxID=116085 RepID=UPI001C8B7B04|nr:ROK family glucokinase [Coprococcus catus]MBX9232226.1 ROK family glucokinase [Coprococcus catus]MCT6800912.1 ROK family glucokinase [Coprococcus catus]
MDKYCFGVDLGGTTVKIGLFSIEGQLQDKWEIPTRTENHGAEILSDIAASIQSRMDTGHLSKEQVTGIGIGVPGPVLNENIVQGCVNLGWGNVRVADELSALTGMKVKAANDANVAALGEQWQGGGKGFQNLVMFTLGTGVGGGIIQNGRIISGANGAAGEIGHMVIVDSDEVVGTCGCGHRGCLEQVASATGIVNLTEKKLAECSQDSVLREISPLTAKDVLDAAKAGDALAEQAAENMMKQLGRAAAYIACVVNPDIFVIGGGVSKAGEYLIEGISRYYKDYAFHASADTKFALASLGNDAGMIGAAGMVCTL